MFLFSFQGTDGPTMYIYNDVLNDAPNAETPLKETLFLGKIIFYKINEILRALSLVDRCV